MESNQSKETKIESSQQDAEVTPVKKSSKGMLIGMITCAILAAGGVGFGVYELEEAAKFSQQISNLKAEVENRDATIAELQIVAETSERELEKKASEETVTITLGAKFDENETRTVYKIADCSADGPSVKCHVIANNEDALISWNSTDSVLRVTLPNNED